MRLFSEAVASTSIFRPHRFLAVKGMHWRSGSSCISSVPVQICERTGPSRDEKRRAAITASEASETFAETPISAGLVSTDRRRTFSRASVGTLYLGLPNISLTVTAPGGARLNLALWTKIFRNEADNRRVKGLQVQRLLWPSPRNPADVGMRSRSW